MDISSHVKYQLAISVDRLLLTESAGKESCCIFRIPDSLSKVNPEAYKPKVVSVGPYHYGDKLLKMIQEHKPRFLKLFLSNAKKKAVEEKDLFEAVAALEEKVRNSYSEGLRQISNELVYMMILDGCFILMLILIFSKSTELLDKEDPVFKVPWILPAIRSDLLLLENQVPFIVLQTLMKVSKIGVFDDLNTMAVHFFFPDRPERHLEKCRNFEGKHLLDLIRMSFAPSTRPSITPSMRSEPPKDSTSDLILPAKRLRLQGIKFRLISDADSILDIRLKDNMLQIPLLRLDESISSIFLNCVAYEQFYSQSTNDITSYMYFMGCLLKGEEDAAFLSNDKQIIENYFGSESEVSQFFKDICKGVNFDMSRSYLRCVFLGVNLYTSKQSNRVWAGFKHTHFESPWTCLSSFAVVFALLLTILQATFAVMSYLNDKKAAD
ncbi:unnamed protein product [Microthlaspi erraticum]|uniref:Uncharacterized protein n=1 Tax=Microthlaspi erraticum TaxID=1685480 RepID=A0A6D2HBB3_9BRAS|nr:unnamed protein product [Microthlaspi erraticum]